MTTNRPNKRQRTASPSTQQLSLDGVPTFDAATEYHLALAAYKKYRVVLLRSAGRGIGEEGSIDSVQNEYEQTSSGGGGAWETKAFTSLHKLATQSTPDLENSWSLEHASTASNKSESFLPSDVLCKYPRARCHSESKSLQQKRQWYCSFILKSSDVVASILRALPVDVLPNSIDHVTGSETTLRHGNAVWVFVGRNKTRRGLMGRPEHTDSVRHDGTWHFQLSGDKLWHLRPTAALCQSHLGTDVWNSDMRISINVSAGDVLLVDTARWWHQTEIRCTLGASEQLSVSYARDIYLNGNSAGEIEIEGEEDGDDMTNVDWLYAPHDIECGTIVLTEEDVPDAAFPESENPNCEVIEDEKGSMVVVALKNIAAGDFFSIAAGGTDEDEDEDEDEDIEEEIDEEDMVHD